MKSTNSTQADSARKTDRTAVEPQQARRGQLSGTWENGQWENRWEASSTSENGIKRIEPRPI
jgi:hypothetical protein